MEKDAQASGLPSTAGHCEPLEWPRKLVAIQFLVFGLWYLGWRATTLNAEAPIFSALIYGAELFGFMCALLHIFMCWRLTVRQASPPPPGMTVDVFVPTYNESVDLVRKTLLAARAMDYPHETWLLDDGSRDAMRALAAQLGVHYLTRADNQHAKAGNLNDALAQTRGDFVAVFDADHAPRRDFLTKTLGYFDDEAVAFVQTPQDFYNLDSYQHRRGRGSAQTVWTEQSLFFRVIQRGKDAWNAAFFCGSCAVVRRTSLEAIGGFATGTVTEDLHTSIRLHAKGFRSIYHAEPLAFGLAPESIEPFISQRIRWGQGAMHVWRKEGLLTHRGLSWAQRLNYLASVLTYFDGWQKGIFYLAPVVVLLTGTMPLIASTPEFLGHFLPYYLFTLWSFEEVGRGYGRTLFIEQYNMARFAAFAWATLAWVLPRRWLRFKVTRKGGLVDTSARYVAPQALVLALNVAAIPLGVAFFVWGGRLPLDGLIANTLWALVNAALALAVLVFTSRTAAFVRSKYRFPVPLPAELEVPGRGALRGTIDDISESGFRFYGPLPAKLEVGQAVCGRIALPDEPMPFRGWVRSVITGEDGLPRAVGCSFETEPEHLHRLETFLFGSDLQWSVNSLSDRIHTPMSRAWPAEVDGPRPSELAGLRWNAAALSDRRVEHESPVMALVSTPQDERGSAVLLSFTALPVGRNLHIEVSKRHLEPAVDCQLSAMTLAAAPPGVHLYRLCPAMPQQARSAFVPGGEPEVPPERHHPDYADTGL